MQKKHSGKSLEMPNAYPYAIRTFDSLGERFGGGKNGREGRRPSAFEVVYKMAARPSWMKKGEGMGRDEVKAH